MKLYAWLLDRVPPPLAVVIAGAWLALLIVLAVFFAIEPQGAFRYGNL